MAYKAGQLGGQDPFGKDKVFYLLNGLTEFAWIYLTAQPMSDPEYRVGTLDKPLQFGDTGFKPEFQDVSNQVRHFVGSFAAGFSVGIPITDVVTWWRERSFLSSNKDVALGELAASLGGNFFGDHVKLAQDIWSQVCGQTAPLSLP